jgi:hypothetical protein
LRQAMTWARVIERNSAMPRKPAKTINSSLHSDEWHFQLSRDDQE